jgi:serine/threonine protein kinase
MPLTIGTRLGPYEILAPLGTGGMGEVYRAHDARLHRVVAIKVLPAELADHRDRVRRFHQEARAASALNHPHIVAIYDTGEVDATNFIVMELIDGVPLGVWIDRQKPDLRHVLATIIQVADALAVAHDTGIIHRDIKPANLLVNRQGYVKVLDFGLAKLIETGPSEETQTIGEDRH